MTIVIAAKKNGRVYIGSDSIEMCDDFTDTSFTKIQRIGTNYVGHAGNTVLQNLLSQYATLDIQDVQDARSFAVKLFEDLLKEQEKWPDSQKLDFDDVLLIATPDKIFFIDRFHYAKEVKEFATIGAGSSYATGSMRALYDILDLRQAVQESLNICCTVCLNCRGPIQLFEVSNASTKNTNAGSGVKRPRNKSKAKN